MADQTYVGNWRLDPARTTIGFRSASFWGLLKVKGTYGVIEGTGEATSPDAVSGRLTIDAASVNTGIGKRDDHLRSADFFDVEKFPTIDVAVDSAQATSSLQVQLTVKGVTRDVDLPVTVTTLNDGAVQIVAKGTVDRSEFGVDGNMMGMIGDTTAVEATAVFVKQS